MFFLLSTLWFIRTTKHILFWLYLWQLKEYHIGRFLDHFRTAKGKQLILNKLNLIKIILLFTFPAVPLLLFFVASVLYIFEFFKALIDFLRRQLKGPVLTKKTAFLIFVGILVEILVLFTLFLNVNNIVKFVFWLLLFDVLIPLITSIIVLIFQPIAVFGRNQVIKKAKEKREKFKDLLVIGITGSYGKTSTKEFLYTILSQKFHVLKTKEHQNSEVGISQCILDDLKEEHEIFVVEMGAYNRGGIKLLCDIAKPKIGILTGINEQHMATFGSLGNIIKTKYELIESLPEDGIAFFNGKNKYCLELYQKAKIKKFLYGQEIEIAGLENLEGAKIVAKELGMSEEEISRACQKIENRASIYGSEGEDEGKALIAYKFGGIQFKKGINGLNIIDATYSANPDSVISHLEYLTLRYPQGKKIIVMPCLIELGSASKEVHKKIGQKIAEVCDLAIITTKDRFKEIKETVGEKAIFLENPKEIFEKIKNSYKEGDTILLESRVSPELIKQLLFGRYQANLLQPIFTSLSPNTEKDDIWLAFKLLFQPWRWKYTIFPTIVENVVYELEEEFKKYLGVKYAISFNSGRSALMAILDVLDIKKDDEILLQSFTCNSAVNPILNRGAKPVFVDIDETLNMDPDDLKEKITSKSKAVMIQHTFGWPAQIEGILEIVRGNNLFLIEDCAHSLGAKYRGKFCGTFGDVAFFSFGRDKIISSVFGGMVVTNNDAIGERIKSFQEKLDFPSNFWIFQQLLHPILANYLILPTYGLNQYLGRILFGFLHKFSVLSKGVYKKEKRGEIPKYFPKKFPNALAILALNQFKKLERFNEHRRKIAKFYEDNLKEKFELPLCIESGNILPTFMRYPILANMNTNEILKVARKRKIYLDDGWRKNPVVPPDTNLKKMGYQLGSCPRAEKIAKSILNLPTHINISKGDAQKIIDFLKIYGS